MCAQAAQPLYEAVDENHRISNVRFAYAKCGACQTIFLDKPPADLGRYYQSDYYDIPTLARLDEVARKDTYKIDTVRRFATKGRLLEIGPAFGIFAWQAKQAGFAVDVIEMDSRCCDYLRNTVGVGVTQSNRPHEAISSLPAHDVIAIWHVLEHLPDPMAFLKAAASNLAPGGVLVIAMPNPDAWQFSVMGKHWPHLDAPRHLTLIPTAILQAQTKELGLSQISFDSDDSDARSWNRFGWQRLLMNRFKTKLMQRAMFIVGWFVAFFMAPLDQRKSRGSAYTVVFKKN